MQIKQVRNFYLMTNGGTWGTVRGAVEFVVVGKVVVFGGPPPKRNGQRGKCYRYGWLHERMGRLWNWDGGRRGCRGGWPSDSGIKQK